MTKTERKACIAARCKILKHATRECDDPTCPGWAVFLDERDGYEIQSCDQCWSSAPEHLRLRDEEALALPEAQAMLRETCIKMDENMSVWARSHGYEGLPGITAHEAAELHARLEEGRLYMEAKAANEAQPS